MVILIVFLFGVANFAMHKAVLESGHPLLGRMGWQSHMWYSHMLSGRFSLGVEFLMLFAALLLTAQGSHWAAFAYGAYSALNALAAWLIIGRHV